ncbi:hypothetical protein [Asaia sp. As-1742]|uniref:hypothetical protein n=1 Tax=Asaia sp. As-1742 TaxID=2608325 RepID=UPI001421ABB1|nr:hypothetical protein [Asaia sp. As-1742]NIE78803.1 hypothetical protein [Asaia sp. As-1742]
MRVAGVRNRKNRLECVDPVIGAIGVAIGLRAALVEITRPGFGWVILIRGRDAASDPGDGSGVTFCPG